MYADFVIQKKRKFIFLDNLNLEEYVEKADKERMDSLNQIKKLSMEVTLLKRTISQMKNSIVDFRNRLNG